MTTPAKLVPLGWRHTLTAYRLACDPDERKNARDHSRPTWWGHLRWMRRMIHGFGRWAWVIVDNETGKRAGLVRMESWSDMGEIEASIVIFPAFRGRGLASWAIAEALGLVWRGVPITAYIRKGNRASMGAFRKAGFRFTGRVVDGFSQFVYGGE